MDTVSSATIPPVIRHNPVATQIPLVCDSPHSGTHYPAGFRCAADMMQMRQGEDNHVQELWGAAPKFGATLIEATFPRVYIDPNRSLKDLDPELLADAWHEPLSPGEKTRLGKGLIWTRLDAKIPIYSEKLPAQHIRQRIETLYQPYHRELSAAIDQNYSTFGSLWHLNLHSMPFDAYARMGIKTDRKLADFVLGDRDGTTCAPEFIDLVDQFLSARGYDVARNDPYKGVELISQIGQPHLNRHSLQVEINRPLYMNEQTREKNEGFTRLQNDLTDLLEALRDYIRSQLKTP